MTTHEDKHKNLESLNALSFIKTEEELNAYVAKMIEEDRKERRLTETEAKALDALLQLVDVTFRAMDDSVEEGGVVKIDLSQFVLMDSKIDILETLPDDQPGYTMTPNAKARWALRNLTQVE